MRLKGNKLAALDSGESFINVRFRPCQIVTLISVAFSYALVKKLAGRFFDRLEVAAGDISTEPSFLIGGESDRHGLVLPKTSRKITHNSDARFSRERNPPDQTSDLWQNSLILRQRYLVVMATNMQISEPGMYQAMTPGCRQVREAVA